MSAGQCHGWLAASAAPLRGELRLPGDKSISHRAIMLGALADGDTRVEGFLEGEDTHATARVLAQLGVHIETPAESERIIRGVGLHGLTAPAGALDCGNAGTGMRLLAGLLAGQAFDSVLSGDASLSSRPMRRVTDPLMDMGARIVDNDGLPPLRISGSRPLHAIDYQPPIASAQVKSAVLLAGLYARGETIVRESRPTRDYTERMLAQFGWPIQFASGEVRLRGGHRLTGTDIVVPVDFSSAAFFLVAASVIPGSDLLLRAVGLGPRRTGLLQALRAMGADIRRQPCADASVGGREPVADLRVRYAPLRGIDVPASLAADMIDEFPALFVAAACARGRTIIRGAAELRVKESDRIATMAVGLGSLGASIHELADGAVIEGGGLQGSAEGAINVDSHGDHRVAMALAVAAQVASAEVRIGDVANVATSFPGFLATATGAGMSLRPVG